MNLKLLLLDYYFAMRRRISPLRSLPKLHKLSLIRVTVIDKIRFFDGLFIKYHAFHVQEVPNVSNTTVSVSSSAISRSKATQNAVNVR